MTVIFRWPLGVVLMLASLTGCCPSAGAQAFAARGTLPQPGSGGTSLPSSVSRRSGSRSPALPTGRAIASLTFRECQRLLERSRVRFEAVPDHAAPHVHEPVYLRSPLEGVSFSAKNQVSEHGMVDCRLAIALLQWAPILHDAGVVRVEHYSAYRPGARIARTRKSSAHARAMAIDAAYFHLEDGRVLDIELDWDERERGGNPCRPRRREDQESQLLRHVVCEAVRKDLFQVVITPHHDRAHQNHVHLELVPDVDWTYIR